MKEIFKKYGIFLSEEQEEKFEKYYQILIEENEKFNITAITDKREVIIKHFVDSVYNVDKLTGKLIDVGSGGGFPAIPLKIVNENLNVTLLEATGKKCEFLKKVIDNLGLQRVNVINGRAEELGRNLEHRESYDFCTARAVARLNSLCEYCMPFVKEGGSFLAFKGDYEEELNEASNAIKTLGGKLKKVDTFEINGAKRGLIYIEKITKTDSKYPRGRGKERKCPL